MPFDQPRSRRERRAAAKLARKAGYFEDFDLTSEAFNRLIENMERRDNYLTEKHRAALMCILGRFTMLAAGVKTGRYAFNLPCGGGKTQSIVAWCAAVAALGRHYSVAVCCSKVESLCELKRDLIANGVPESMVALRHSYHHDPAKVEAAREGRPEATGYASEPNEDEDRQILLVTHARARGAKALESVSRHNGRKRNLIVWDESLIVSEARAIEARRIMDGINLLTPRAEDSSATSALKEATKYLVEAHKRLADEMERQRIERAKPCSIHLPECDPAKLGEMVKAITGLQRKEPIISECLEGLLSLLRMSQAPLRAVASNQSLGGYVKYDLTVPSEIKNVAVLDASWAIRDLERMDRSIQEDPSFDGDVTSYEGVTIRQLKHAAGRGAMTKAFSQRREDRKVSQEVVSVLKGIPKDEATIIFTFKKRGKAPDMRETLKSDLQAAGVDPYEKLFDGRKRFVWLTWGNETSVSEWSYCRNVIFAGVLHRSELDLAGAIVGQRDDLCSDVTTKELRQVQLSEAAHSLYQAMSRGSCRVNRNGYAAPMNVWMLYPCDDIRPLIDKSMPGVVWANWECKHLAKKVTKTEDLAKRITSFLEDQDVSVKEVSVRYLKRYAGLRNVPAQTFRYARDAALRATEGWTLKGRSFCRI